jgi:phosphatidylserine decarboxylase precursor
MSFIKNNKMKSKCVLKLKSILDGNKKIKEQVENSIAKAKEINPDKKTNPVQSLDEFYDFIESSLTRMPWGILDANFYEVHKNPDLAFKTDQSIIYPYWLIDIPLDELKDNKKFYNSVEYIDEISEWLTDYCNEWKEFLDSPKSWNENIHQIFKNEKSFELDKGLFEDSSNWKSFNDFFSRKLKPGIRPIDCINDDSIVITPVDSLPQGIWNINKDGIFEAEEITDDNGVTLKSKTFINIEQLLGEKCKKYGKNFYGGKLTHCYLHYNDYHRYHFPISGTVLEAEIISPSPLVGGIVYWDKNTNSYVLKSNSLSWQAFETRAVVIVETSAGLVALLPIGMGQVSSVNLEPEVKKGLKVKKGDPLGYFLFGGSDFVMVFEEKADFNLTVKKSGLVKGYGNGYEHVVFGQQYGTINISI